MIAFVLYLVKVSIVLVILFGFYQLALKRTTFFKLNRVYLILIPVAAFVVPLVNLPLTSSQMELDLTLHEFNEALVFYESTVISAVSDTEQMTFAIGPTVVVLYAVVALVFLFRMSSSIARLLQLLKSPIEPEGFRWVGGDLPSFTFMKSIFIQEKLAQSPKLAVILAHEKVHSRQLHSLDLVIVELTHCLLWFNPATRALQKAILQNHEFIADQVTLKQYPDLTGYIDLMYRSIMGSPVGISNAFNFSNINDRITMITKVKTQKYQAALYLLALPIIAITSMAFSPRWKIVPDLGLTTYSSPYRLERPKFQWPIEKSKANVFRITATFRKMNNPILKKEMMHKGLDIVAPTGTNVRSAEAGQVIKAEYDDKYGKYVVVSHSENYTTLYAHLSAIDVSVGAAVSAGQTVGKLGNTGQSTGPHLHFEIRQGDTAVDPEPLLK